MKFTLNRDLVHASRLGHSIEFKKGEATFVPPALYAEVLALGAESDDALPEAPVANPNEPTDPEARYAALVAAFEAITLRNVREDFAGSGTPHLQPLSQILGWTVDAKERDIAWARMRAGSDE